MQIWKITKGIKENEKEIKVLEFKLGYAEQFGGKTAELKARIKLLKKQVEIAKEILENEGNND